MRRRLSLILEFDYRRPLECRAAVAELREKSDPADWAMLEALAIEVARQSAADSETVRAAAGLLLGVPERPG